jgi:acetyl-CoA carboxylase biotin carboxyl carrier protein
MARNSKTSKKSSKVPSKAAAPAKAAKAPKYSGQEDFPEVRSLIELLRKNHLAVLEFEKGDLRVTLKTPAGAAGGGTFLHAPAPAAGPQAPAASVSTPVADAPSAEPPKGNYKEITSPMVGTFYSSPSPDAPAFVEVGKTVNADTVVCIIEAMKVMNEIKAEISGKVVEIVAENGKPVQFGQVLFRVS